MPSRKTCKRKPGLPVNNFRLIEAMIAVDNKRSQVPRQQRVPLVKQIDRKPARMRRMLQVCIRSLGLSFEAQQRCHRMERTDVLLCTDYLGSKQVDSCQLKPSLTSLVCENCHLFSRFNCLYCCVAIHCNDWPLSILCIFGGSYEPSEITARLML